MSYKSERQDTDDDICLGETFEFKPIDYLIISALWWGKVKFILSGAEMSDFKITKTVYGNWIFWLSTFNGYEKRIRPLCYMKIGKMASFLLDLTRKFASKED